MTANPYVVEPTGPSATSGTFLIDDVVSLAGNIRDGNWVEAGLDAAVTAIDAVATYSDPLGSAIAAGIGFILDHLEPLKGWLNDLTGDAAQVAANAGTYANVSAGLGTEATIVARSVTADLSEMSGAAIVAYRAFMGDLVETLRALADGADASSGALETASMLVQVVHDLVRDAIAEIVGSAISYAAELILTLGAATPLVIEQVSTRVASLSARLGSNVTGLVRSVGNLKDLIKRLDELIQSLKRFLDDIRPRRRRDPDEPEKPKQPGDPLAPESRPDTAGEDWEGRVADNGKGEVWQRPGAPNNADSVRIMEPTDRYPNGYVRFYNEHGQPIGLDGKPNVPGGTKADNARHTHIPINPDGTYSTPEGWNP